MTKKKFENQTRMEQRVSIAKDVIAQLNAKKLIAKSGVYVQAMSGKYVKGEFTGKKLVKNMLPARCQVCALGSMLCSVARNTPLTVQDIYSDRNFFKESDVRSLVLNHGECMEALDEYFTPYELERIEALFEGWEGDLRLGFPDSDSRLKVIMQSIVDNGGKVV